MGSREDLFRFVEGLDDREIERKVEADDGVDAFLGKVFRGVQQSFVADRAAGRRAVAQWDILAPGGLRSWTLRVADGRCDILEGPADAPELRLQVSLPDYLRLVAGTLSTTKAVLTRRLRLSGDYALAQELSSWFDGSAGGGVRSPVQGDDGRRVPRD